MGSQVVVHLIVVIYKSIFRFSATAKSTANQEPREKQLSVAEAPRLGELSQGDRSQQSQEGVRIDLHESSLLGRLGRYTIDS